MQMVRSIDQSRIGIAIAVEVGPGKLTNARDAMKWVDWEKRTVAIVAQHGGRATSLSHHNVKIAVRLDVHSPGSRVRCVDHR